MRGDSRGESIVVRGVPAMPPADTTRPSRWHSSVRLGGRTRSLLCIVGLALLPFVVFWEVATFREIPIAGDITDQYYPIQYLIQFISSNP